VALFQATFGENNMHPAWTITPFDARGRLAFYKFLTKSGQLFIIRTAKSRGDFSDAKTMTDLIYIGVVVLFFVVSGWYVRACDKM
jgi:hypothetical protein